MFRVINKEMSMERNVDIEGGFVPDFSGLQGGAVDQLNVDLEGGRKKRRSPATILFHKERRERLKREGRSKCPKGSEKDHRKHNRNPSGCRRKDRSVSPRHVGRPRKSGSPTHKRHRELGTQYGSRKTVVHRLHEKSGSHRKGSLFVFGMGAKKIYRKNWPARLREAYDE